MACQCNCEAMWLELQLVKTIVEEKYRIFEEREKLAITQLQKIFALLNENAVEPQFEEPLASTSTPSQQSADDDIQPIQNSLFTLGLRASVITEKDGDLFSADESFSLAHCVAAEFGMDNGIAANFRDRFQRVDELLGQHKNVGQVAVLSDKGRFIYYLITKQRTQEKPTLASLERSLWNMAEHCHANGVKRLAMPRICCGRNRLNWPQVKALIEQIFVGSGVEITVYNGLQLNKCMKKSRKKSSLYIFQKPMKVVDIEKGTGFIYFCAEDNSVTPTIQSLDSRYNFLPSFRAAKRVCGDIVETTRGNEVFYGMVVKKTGKDRLSYGHLLSCLKKLRTKNNAACFEYFGIEAFRDGGDELTMHKVITVIRNVFGGSKYKVEFWVCFPKKFVDDMD